VGSTADAETIGRIKAVLDGLCAYYAHHDGAPHILNETQLAVYVEELWNLTGEELELVTRACLRSCAFFPKVSEMLEHLDAARAVRRQVNAVEQTQQLLAARHEVATLSKDESSKFLAQIKERMRG
jgi:hypothetical protein